MFGLEMENYIVKCILEVQPCKRLSEVVSFEIFMSEWQQLAASQLWGSLQELLILTFCRKLGMEQEEFNICMQGVRVGNYFHSAQAWRWKLI